MARRKRNRGWFKKGADPRRHELTLADRQKAYETTMARYGDSGDYFQPWLWKKCKTTAQGCPWRSDRSKK